MKEKERWQNLVFCFVRVKRVLKEKVVIVEDVMHLESGSEEEKGATFFSFFSF
jgi:hypothetical protein